MKPNEPLVIEFTDLAADFAPTTVILAGDGVTLGKVAGGLDKKSGGSVDRAAKIAQFKGKSKSTFELLAPRDIAPERLVVVGTGKDKTETDWALIGGAAVVAAGARKAAHASLIVDVDATDTMKPFEIAAALAYGAELRHYSFDKYLTKKNGAADGDTDASAKDGLTRLTVHCAGPEKARAAYERHSAVAQGVHLARNLVNEPANVLGPVEFAEQVEALSRVGVEVEILDDNDLRKLKMGSLLCVSQGSARPARVCIMQWNGAKSKKAKPLAFVGKGVVFDTGGISIKPAQGMEDMKGDMGGAACVTGLMHALAARKANVNAVGIIGVVENMPSGTATRPGDIVTSMSGQTIEVLNTDAEGRLVLADVMTYVQDRFKPRLMIDLATLTGAIMVALGKEYAGMFCNDDVLAQQLSEAGAATGEKVWRMPLDKGFDKMIESKNADMKNIGGRWGGSCTAAAFLQRFVHKDMVWAHLDIAGTAMDSTKNEISPSWASGYGVRLLDRLVADHYEKDK
ncbi:MAG: leucyl aminopeptidase [Hyphomicrobiaceae bacterium]|nr:leucyl aminopeptidase [Hyphomicrobiaceae bacterium]